MQSVSETPNFYMQRMKVLEDRISGLESRIEVEIKFSKMAHDLCNTYQYAYEKLLDQNRSLIEENARLEKMTFYKSL